VLIFEDRFILTLGMVVATSLAIKGKRDFKNQSMRSLSLTSILHKLCHINAIHGCDPRDVCRSVLSKNQ
jgi:hypothetical protein